MAAIALHNRAPALRLLVRALGLIELTLLTSCLWPGELPRWDLERMDRQNKDLPYALNPFFADQMAMRDPPPGTVARDQIVGRPALSDGTVDGRDVTQIPLPVDMAMLHAGRFYFENICAACHGVLGDGHSVVAENMRLRMPPSLITQQVSAFPPGRVYGVITAGYGVMPRFGYRLSVPDRWAIVAYLRALQLSRRARPLADLPPEVQRRARRALP